MAPKAKRAESKGKSALVKIQEYAKEIQKAHPDKKWTSCIKEGSAKYRASKQ